MAHDHKRIVADVLQLNGAELLNCQPVIEPNEPIVVLKGYPFLSFEDQVPTAEPYPLAAVATPTSWVPSHDEAIEVQVVGVSVTNSSVTIEVQVAPESTVDDRQQ